ncbi:MAG TPA: peptidylprolyl isomerase [Stellaceae bacterium]|nr:peptidylprolyl isomerase [Stellaceae bacterium]
MACRALLAACLIALMAMPAMAQKKDKAAPEKGGDPIVARVNGQVLHRSDIEIAMHGLPPDAQQQVPPQQLYLQVLEQAAADMLLAQAGRKAKIDAESGVKSEIMLSENDIIAKAYIASLARTQITEAKLKEAYAQYVKAASQQEEIHARHIVLSNEQEAKDVIAQLNKGADFATLAKEKSIDPQAKATGGDLGYLTQNEVANEPEFAAAAFALKKGEFTQSPVHTRIGWHVIKVEDRRPVKVGTYDQVVNQLAQREAGDIANKKVEELRRAGKVELFDPQGKPLAMGGPPKAAPAAPAEAPKAAPAQKPAAPPLAMPGQPFGGSAPGAPTLAPGTAPDQLGH